MKKAAFLPLTDPIFILEFAWDGSLDASLDGRGSWGIPSRLTTGARKRPGTRSTGSIEHWVHDGSVVGARVWVHVEEGAVGIGATVALVKLANSLSVLHGALHSVK